MQGGHVALQDEVTKTTHYPAPRGDSNEEAQSPRAGRGATPIPERRHERWTKHSACFKNEEYAAEKIFTKGLFSFSRGVSVCSQDRASGTHSSIPVSRSPSYRVSTATQSWHPPSDNFFNIPKMLPKGRRTENGDTLFLRRRLNTAGNCTSRVSRGVVSDGEFGQAMTGSGWSGITKVAHTSSNDNHLSSVYGSVQSISNSSVSSLLQEEMAFRRKNNEPYG